MSLQPDSEQRKNVQHYKEHIKLTLIGQVKQNHSYSCMLHSRLPGTHPWKVINIVLKPYFFFHTNHLSCFLLLPHIHFYLNYKRKQALQTCNISLQYTLKNRHTLNSFKSHSWLPWYFYLCFSLWKTQTPFFRQDHSSALWWSSVRPTAFWPLEPTLYWSSQRRTSLIVWCTFWQATTPFTSHTSSV